MSDAPQLLDVRMIERRAKALAAQLGVSEDYLTALSETREDGSPHIEVSDAYYFIVRERGIELRRRRTADLDELLCWILEGIVSSLSWDFELRQRRAGEDSRRQGFVKQVELLRKLSPAWVERQERHHEEILKHHPFHDA